MGMIWGWDFFSANSQANGRFPRFPKTLTLSSLPVPRPVRGSSVFTLATLVTLVALSEAVTEKCIARGEVLSTPALAKQNRPKKGNSYRCLTSQRLGERLGIAKMDS